MLKLVNIEGGYSRGSNILKGISFEIPQGETLAVIGQNGSGKSTLAKAIINALPFRKGEVWLNGNNITNYNVQEITKAGIGVFLQGGKVFQHLTVKENLMFAGRNLRNKDFKMRVDELLHYFSVFNEKKHWNLQASYLSGGQQNSLALMMVLLNKPQFLILDEPSAGLSVTNVKELYSVLHTIKRLEKITTMLIEQNIKEAISFGGKVIIIKRGLAFENISKYELKYTSNFDFFSE